MSLFTEVAKIDKKFCPVFPRGISSLTSAVSNLPVIILFIISLPVRTFLCVLSSITSVPLYGVLANLFPPLTLACSLTQGSESSCFSNCPYCSENADCLTIPSEVFTFCEKSRPYFSILDQIFCLLGYVLIVLISPITELINIPLALFGKQLCLNSNPNLCSAVSS